MREGRCRLGGSGKEHDVVAAGSSLPSPPSGHKRWREPAIVKYVIPLGRQPPAARFCPPFDCRLRAAAAPVAAATLQWQWSGAHAAGRAERANCRLRDELPRSPTCRHCRQSHRPVKGPSNWDDERGRGAQPAGPSMTCSRTAAPPER